MADDSGEFSDELDEFEESVDDRNYRKGGDKGAKGGPASNATYANKPYDEAYELSQDLSVAESYDGRETKVDRERKLRNDKYDEAMDISMSVDHGNTPAKSQPKGKATNPNPSHGGDSKDAPGGAQSILNRPFDEALEFSQSGSDDSVDTASGRKGAKSASSAAALQQPSASKAAASSAPGGSAAPSSAVAAGGGVSSSQPQRAAAKSQPLAKAASPAKASPSDDEEEEEEDDNDESYDHIEGAYNPKDYSNLNVAAEIKDLFQYIERFRPQEQELDTALKCFIPDYIPAIGEMDAYIKIPRPDGKEDDLGLRVLDEPAASQSDPTVLELQLRASSKKVQYGDVVVRSIENSAKNPVAIDRWIQSIQDLHRSKPPPQVHYRRNMPDIEQLMDVWPAPFEKLLDTVPLPSPDLEMSLAEYCKALTAILDIPTYDNPVEPLHLMFSLYMDFRNNPHFQARADAEAGATAAGGEFYDAYADFK